MHSSLIITMCVNIYIYIEYTHIYVFICIYEFVYFHMYIRILNSQMSKFLKI